MATSPAARPAPILTPRARVFREIRRDCDRLGNQAECEGELSLGWHNRMLPRIVLASQSPARRKLLATAGLTFDVQPSHFDETSIQSDNLAQMVETLALKKAEVVAQQIQAP
ncbi:MAG: Maf family protein, partial [Cyanobacteria bacterium J06648_11]